MISNCSSIGLCVLLNLILLCQGLNTAGNNVDRNNNKDQIGFPEYEEENPDNQHKLHTPPVQIKRCKEGELYYPGDQNNDWVCDCKPGYLYYPPDNKCYAAYRKGPCRPGQYLLLPPSSVIPECIPNPCIHDKYVNFRGICLELGKSGPCPVPELMNVIGVNETTLEIICTLGFTKEQVMVLSSRIEPPGSTEKPSNQSSSESTVNESTPTPEPEFFFSNKTDGCLRGGKRWTEEKCPQQNEEKNIVEIFGKF